MDEVNIATVNAKPTKDFFMSMLTRDIEIKDAILDLLDNCLDGVARTQSKKGICRSSEEFYNGFYANIIIGADSFEISDNCGGIPRNKALKEAFRMGRDDSFDKEACATVGIYGIGMKRAIFKMGRRATIQSNTEDGAFIVEIPETWESDRENWGFPIRDIVSVSDKNEYGTQITVGALVSAINDDWKDDDRRDVFLKSLIAYIKQSYSYIISRGFVVTVNDIRVEQLSNFLLFSKEKGDIQPYIYQNEIDGVSISCMVGFYSNPPSLEESDELASGQGAHRSSDESGCTIICNDRVILYNNKDHLTGWGENSVPRFHPQFIGILGMIVFESNDASKLPMTTTKRGIDLASPVYSMARKRLCEGLKLFTNFTNEWKGRAAQLPYFSSERVQPVDYRSILEGKGIVEELSFSKTQDQGVGMQYKPVLPKPEKNMGSTNIRYSMPNDEFNIVKDFLLDELGVEFLSPGQVGEETFKIVRGSIHREAE